MELYFLSSFGHDLDLSFDLTTDGGVVNALQFVMDVALDHFGSFEALVKFARGRTEAAVAEWKASLADE